MEEIRDSFNKVKKDIYFLNEEINKLKTNFSYLNKEMNELKFFINNNLNLEEKLLLNKTNITFNKTEDGLFKALKAQNLHISIGNKGVPTDKQTNRQTPLNSQFNQKKLDFNIVSSFLDSLDDLKKEIRLKFKKLTDQEMVVFSSIYGLEQEIGYANYKLLAERLNLTESSIRDYLRRLLIKGIPIDKEKLNNKEIILKISPNGL